MKTVLVQQLTRRRQYNDTIHRGRHCHIVKYNSKVRSYFYCTFVIPVKRCVGDLDCPC